MSVERKDRSQFSGSLLHDKFGSPDSWCSVFDDMSLTQIYPRQRVFEKKREIYARRSLLPLTWLAPSFTSSGFSEGQNPSFPT